MRLAHRQSSLLGEFQANERLSEENNTQHRRVNPSVVLWPGQACVHVRASTHTCDAPARL